MSDIAVRQLACGAPLVVEKMSGVRSAAVGWLVPAGSAMEDADSLGESTMWSELVLRGAGDLASRQQADAFDRLGVSRSVEPGTYSMRIGATLLGSEILRALPLLADMVLRPRMDEESIEPCRDLALQALASLRDDPPERATHLAREHHFPPPFNRSGLGTEQGLNSLTRDGLIRGWLHRVRPAGSIIAVAGAVDPDPIEAALNQLLSAWSGATPEPQALGPATRGYHHEEDPSNQVQIIIVHDAPREPDDDSLLEKVVISVLSGGMAGRLFSEVREKRGLCYSVNAGYRGDKTFGAVSAYVGTTPEKAQESLDVLTAELRRISTPQGRVTLPEFQRAVIGMKSGLIFSGESTGARAASLAADVRRLGRPRSLEELTSRLDAVTLDEVNAYLARRDMGRFTIQTLGPRPLNPPA